MIGFVEMVKEVFVPRVKMQRVQVRWEAAKALVPCASDIPICPPHPGGCRSNGAAPPFE